MHHLTHSDTSWLSFPWDLSNLKMPKEARLKPFQKGQQQLSLGRRHKGRQTKEADDEMPSQSASIHKLSFRKQDSLDSGGDQHATQQWLIVNVVRLNELISGLICSNCAEPKINIDL